MPQVHCGIGFWATEKMRLPNRVSDVLVGRNRSGLLIGFLVLVALLAVFAPNPPRETGSRGAGSPGETTPPAARFEGVGGLGARRDAFLLQGVVDLFSSTSWLPPPSPAVASKPVAPAFPFHFVGTLADGKGERQVFLAQHGSGVIVTPKVGDVLAGAFKVEAIGGEQLSLIYVPLNEKLTVSFSSMGPEPAARPPVAAAPNPDSASGGTIPGAGGLGVGGAANAVSALPPISGIGVAASSSAPASSAAAAGSSTGGSGAGTIGSGSGSSAGGIGTSSPASPGAAPSSTLLGALPASTAPLGTAPTATGTLGTAPLNPDGSIMFGPIPTGGGPAVK